MKPEGHQFEDKLLEFAYGELPAPEAGAVEAHVRGCDRCRRALEEIRSVRATMRQLPLEEAPAGGLDSLLAYAQGQAQRNARASPRPWWKLSAGGRWLGPLASAAALTLVATVAWRAKDSFEPQAAAVAVEAPAPSLPAAVAVREEVAAVPSAPEPSPLAKQLQDRDQVQHGADARRVEAKLETKGAALALKKTAGADLLAGSNQDYSNARAAGGLGSLAVGGSIAVEGRGGYGLGAAGAADQPARARAEREASRSPVEALGAAAPAPKAKADDRAPASAPPSSLATSAAEVAPEPPPPGRSSRATAAGPIAAAPSAPSLELRGKAGQARPAQDEVASSAASEAVQQAILAGDRGDRTRELRHVLEALRAEVSGPMREEMLSRGCRAAEALGDTAQADRLCDLLLVEYPSGPAAEALAARRGRVQKAAPAKAATPVKK